MCDKAVLDEVTKRVCAAAKQVLGDKLEKVILKKNWFFASHRIIFI
jgi:hypothetical protein